MVGFIVGDLFDSATDLQQKLNDYSEKNFCHFYIKDSKKLTQDETVNPNLIYKHIVYSCIYGGQKPRFRGSGSRSVTSIRHGCTSSLYLRVTKDRLNLQVRSFNESHNHEVSEELFRSAAQDKKLPWDLRIEVEEMLLLGADKDRVCEYVRDVSRKSLDKKNLFNMYETAVKQQREISRDRAILLIQKVYAVNTEEEAEHILSQLLENSRPSRRNRKQEPDSGNIQYIVNDTDETADGSVPQETIHRLMGTLNNEDGELVIIQGDEEYAVYNADDAMEAEYLEDDEGKETEIVVKQEVTRKDESAGNESPRYVTFKDVSRGQTKKRGQILNNSGKERGRKYVQEDAALVFEPPTKTRMISRDFAETEETITEVDPLGNELRDVKIATLRAETQKLQLETELLVLKRNKLSRELTKLEIEKNKLHLEIEVTKQSKAYMIQKTQWITADMQNKELKNEKLKLEIAKLKGDTNGN